MQHHAFPLTSMLADLIVITMNVDHEDARSFQTIVQRVGADQELLRERVTRSELAARSEHQRAELWAANHVVERWLRSVAPREESVQLGDALHLLGIEQGARHFDSMVLDDALEHLGDRLQQRLDALDAESSKS